MIHHDYLLPSLPYLVLAGARTYADVQTLLGEEQ